MWCKITLAKYVVMICGSECSTLISIISMIHSQFCINPKGQDNSENQVKINNHNVVLQHILPAL